jgi:hypothetical protein
VKRPLAIIALVALALSITAGIALADTTYQDGFVTQTEGGGMVSSNGQIEWGILANSNPSSILARYYPDVMNKVQGPPAGTIWVGSPFLLEVWNSDIGKLINTAKPMTLVVHYSPSDLGGRSESTIRLVRLYDQWSEFPSTVDTVNHVVTTQIYFGGDYGLIASNAAPAAAAPAPVAAPAPAPVAAPAPAPVAAPAPAPVAAPVAAPAPEPAPAPAPAPAANPVSVAVPSTVSAMSGKVFYDKNGNGVMDGDDFPVAGAGLLISNGDWIAFTRTGSDGSYAFSSLGSGSYGMNLVVGPEWGYTTPNAVAGVSLTGQSGSNGTADFGIWYK